MKILSDTGALPININTKRLDDGNGIEETLRRNKAIYHRHCKSLFSDDKTSRATRKRTHDTTDNAQCTMSKVPRKIPETTKEEICFLCELDDGENLRSGSTLGLNDHLNDCAYLLGLLAKLSAGDIIAQEVKYHHRCLVDLYNLERAYLNAQGPQCHQEYEKSKQAYATAFSEVLTYISESEAITDSDPPIFKLADLIKLYNDRLVQLGADCPNIHSTRFKNQLLKHMPELNAYPKGKHIMLAFEKDVGVILEQASHYGEAIHQAKAAMTIRRDMLKNKTKFDGSFQNVSLEETIPPSLLKFVSMLEHGADIKSQLEKSTSKCDLTIAQLLQYNCFAQYVNEAKYHRHSKDRETPVAIYTGITAYARTRKKELIDTLHKHGLSITYDRVMELTTQLGETVVDRYKEDGVVCPAILKKFLFTTGAVDNVDHNPSSTTAMSCFHGTSLSIFQHPSPENLGDVREPPTLKTNMKGKTISELPESYTNIRPACLPKNPEPTPSAVQSLPAPLSLQTYMKQTYEWLEVVNLAETVDKSMKITWAAYHAEQVRNHEFEVSICSLLPLFREPSQSVATIKHTMEKVAEATAFLNSGQIPVITADQPLFALAKQIQWQWPEYGEDKYVVMFGGLHIESNAMKSAGTLLNGSGWTSAIMESDIASCGTAQSFLSAKHITRTRRAHQITACTLYKMMKDAYEAVDDGDGYVSFEDWGDQKKKEHPQFCFWKLVLDMELVILALVRSFREGDFDLYCASLAELIPFFFANNNTKYARWLSVHYRDMISLEKNHPNVAQEFKKGNFTVHKSKRVFSGIAIDQAHEQHNAIIKGDGGAIGLTEDPEALRRWMIAGPEISRLIAEYESLSTENENLTYKQHHDESYSSQISFFKEVQDMYSVMNEMGNPFQDDSKDLFTLDTKDVAASEKPLLLEQHLDHGKEQFQSFVQNMQTREKTFYEPIRKNNVKFFSHEHAGTKDKPMKDDCKLFQKLFISCQNRDLDLEEFFKHENSNTPASLSENCEMYSGTKSDLAHILISKVTTEKEEPMADTIIIDGANLIQSLRQKKSKTFAAYAKEDVLPRIAYYSSRYKRVHVVFDVYVDPSLKAGTRAKRGKGIRRKVTVNGKTPKDWHSFLRNNDNKNELFKFLAQAICQLSTTAEIVVTTGETTISNKEINMESVSPCTHEEGNTRVFVHAKYATMDGSKCINIKANDTDVIVIAVAVQPILQALGLKKMWVSFGQGTSTKWVPIHDIAKVIGLEKTSGILFFHAFTGCDVVSAFRHKGKKTAWLAWETCSEVSQTFTRLSQCPRELSDHDLKAVEHFLITMYDKSSAAKCVNEARHELFTQKVKDFDAIPPTRAVLSEHAKRAAYQGGIVWGQATIRDPEIPNPADWGWFWKNKSWEMCWSTLPPLSKSCQELKSCTCKVACRGNCKCFKAGFPCSALCSCVCEA